MCEIKKSQTEREREGDGAIDRERCVYLHRRRGVRMSVCMCVLVFRKRARDKQARENQSREKTNRVPPKPTPSDHLPPKHSNHHQLQSSIA